MIILSVLGIKRERTVITSQSQKGVWSNSKEQKKPIRNTQNPVTNLVSGAMKHKLVTIFTSCFILILCVKSSTAKALTPEDVESLLPPDPHDKNDTIAAVVQDPVVQDAVTNAVNNGSLNGLVVKKHTFIMPATDPKKVLSKREHLLVVPTENLEDVRKNITEAKQAETRETSTAGNQAFFEEYASEYTPEEDENRNERDESGEKRKSGTEFLKDALSHGSALLEPEDTTEKKVAVPIVAVIDPTNADKGKVKSPIVAILPNQPNLNVPVNNQVQFLKDNSNQIQKEAQDFVDGSSLTLNTNYYWKPTPEIAPLPGSSPISLYADEVVPSLSTEVILTPVVMPQWNLVPLADDQGEETGDMDVAEDIIFRPLFRYRQENNRRLGYASNYYPRRSSNYRNRYSDYS